MNLPATLHQIKDLISARTGKPFRIGRFIVPGATFEFFLPQGIEVTIGNRYTLELELIPGKNFEAKVALRNLLPL